MNIKRIKAFLVLLSFLAYMPLSCLQVFAAPELSGAVGGTVTQNGTETLVTVGGNMSGAVGQFDWSKFNVNSNESVNWAFTNKNQTAINRVLGNNPSFINGILKNSGSDAFTQTSRVIFINPSGILFGAGSSVNLNSFTASTYDIAGIKNVRDGQTIDNLKVEYGYTKQRTNPDEKVSVINFAGGTFDRAANQYAGLISADGASIEANSSLIFVAKDINIYNGSVLKTNLNYNYPNPDNIPSYNLNYSNVKLVTSDGVNFEYRNNGYVKNGEVVVKNGVAGVDYNINLTDAYITTGDLYVKNAGMTNGVDTGVLGSNINIDRTQIKGYKLVNRAFGDIYIVGNNQVNVQDSIISTHNTYNPSDLRGTTALDGGNVTIKGGQRVNIKNTDIKTEYSTNSTLASGDVNIESKYGYVWIDETAVDARGNINIYGLGETVVADTILTARNANVDVAKDIYKTISITGENVELSRNAIDASSDVSILARTLASADTGVISGYGNVTLHENHVINSGLTLSILGKDTTISDSLLSYYNLKLFDEAKYPTLMNNVLITGSPTFNVKQANGANAADNHLVISTNGNLTVDGSTLKAKGYTMSQEIVGQKTINGVLTDVYRNKYTPNATSVDQTRITLNSTKGDVRVQNGSNIATTSKNIEVTANTGNVTICASVLDSADAVKLTAANALIVGNSSDVQGKTGVIATGKTVEVKNSTIKSIASGDVTATATAGVLILDKATIASAAKVNLTSSATFVAQNGTNVTGATGIITSAADTNILNSSMTATTGDIVSTSTTGSTYVDKSILKANTGKVTLAAANGTMTIDNESEVKGQTGVSASGKSVSIINSKLNAVQNNVDVIASTDGIDINKGTLIADAGNVNLTAKTAGKNINITNGSLLDAGSALNILGQNTLLQDSNATYNTIALYDGTVTNNVTIKGTSQITDKKGPLVLVTNGNLTIDANKLQKIGGANQSKITLTGNDVAFINASNVATTTDDITVTGTNSVTVDGSIIASAAKTNITANNADVVIRNASTVKAVGDVNLTATKGQNTLQGVSTVESTTGNVNILQAKSFLANGTPTTSMGADAKIKGNNINITTTNTDADIKFVKNTYTNVERTGKLTLKAGRDNIMDSVADWDIQNAELIAGRDNKITGSTAVGLTDVKMTAVRNNTVQSDTSAVNLKNVEIAAGSATNTNTVNANTDISLEGVKLTKGVSTLNATNGNVKTVTGTALDINSTKLYVNAGKDVNLNLANAGNVNLGIEVRAGLTDAVTNGTTTLTTVGNGPLSISRIITGNLNLTEGNKFLSAKDTVLTAAEIKNVGPSYAASSNPSGMNLTGRSYIEVKNYGGFNFDTAPREVPETTPTSEKLYEGSFDATTNTVTDDTTYGKHYANLNQDSTTDGRFLLVYGRPGSDDLPAPLPETVPGGEPEFLNDYLRLPQQADILGTPGPILNNLSDPLPGMVAAAAGITLEEEDDDIF